MKFYKRERLYPDYFTVSSGNLVNYGLFAYSTEYVLIDPTSTQPNDVLTSGQLTALKQTSSTDFSVLAASFTDTSWTSNSWNMTSDDTFTAQLNTWISNNIHNGFESTNIVIMRGNVLGTNYTTVFTYPGNQGKTNLTFSKISSSVGFSLGLDSEGYALTWGFTNEPNTNDFLNGQLNRLGNGAILNKSSPVTIAMGKIFSKLATGLYNNFCLGIESSTGMLWGWGNNSFGQLGDGTTFLYRKTPVNVLGGRSFSDVTAGLYQTSALEASTGFVWCWGRNQYGYLGDGTIFNKSSPISVLGGRSFSKISKGSYLHTLAIEGSTGFCWGWGQGNTLGDGTIEHRSSPVSVLGGRSFSQLAGGTSTSLGIEASTGLAWTWGYNGLGQLGEGTTENKSSPVSVLGGRSYNKACIGSRGLAIEGSTGNAWTWGHNIVGWGGQLGDGTTESKSSPVGVLGGRSYSEVAGGQNQSLALEASTGYLWSWGDSSYGQLGNLTNDPQSSPISVVGGKSFNKIYSGKNTLYGLDSSGIAWGIGRDSNAELGDNIELSRSTPVYVLGNRKYSKITAYSGVSILALESSTGYAWMWGNNSFGQLGNGTTKQENSPIKILGNISFSEISNLEFTCSAIEGSTGIVWGWGSNSYGQLGDNTTIHKSSPITLVGGKSFSKVEAGAWNIAAIEGSTGLVWGWGWNDYGVIGDGTTIMKSSPVTVLGGKSFNAITCTSFDTLGIEGSTGIVWGWGLNQEGKLGEGTTTRRSSPVSALGGRSFFKINAKEYTTLAIEGSTGYAWACGGYSSGEYGIGDGTTNLSSSPVSVVGGRSFKEIASGYHNFAIEASTGQAFGWGKNIWGELGDGTFESRSSPVSIYSNI